MPVTGTVRRRQFQPDLNWSLLGATLPLWVVLVVTTTGFVAPDICYSTVAPAADRLAQGFVLGLGGGHGWTWLLMVAATTPPVLYPMAQYVAVRSFPERRWRAVGLLAAGYTVPWLFAFVVAVAVLTVLAVWLPRDFAGAAAFGLAALWQFLPSTSWAWTLRHQTGVLAAHGAKADLSVLACGLRHGLWCVWVCGPMMIACLAVEPHAVAMLLCWPLVLLQERRPSPRTAALALMGVWGATQGIQALAVLSPV